MAAEVTPGLMAAAGTAAATVAAGTAAATVVAGTAAATVVAGTAAAVTAAAGSAAAGFRRRRLRRVRLLTDHLAEWCTSTHTRPQSEPALQARRHTGLLQVETFEHGPHRFVVDRSGVALGDQRGALR